MSGGGTNVWGSGAIYAGGKWKDITSYASGGTAGLGQLFIAREAGPELVGTIGGHTAIMNNDQIVASVSAGVARAISGIKFYASGGGGSSSEDVFYRAIMRALNDSSDLFEVDLDGEAIARSTASVYRRQVMAGLEPLAGAV